MTTKNPPKVKEFSEESLEKIAYNAVRDISTVEPNDINRLGYHIFLFLRDKKGRLANAVAEAEARLLIPKQEAIKIIKSALEAKGITVE